MSIKIENIVPPSAEQWAAAIRGMRNPMRSWERTDTYPCKVAEPFGSCGDCPMVEYGEEPGIECNDGAFGVCVGKNDLDLMRRLAKAGSDHRKYLRMLPVIMDVTAPLYWWKEADTYKVGTVANSCSTMHKIAEKEFRLDDFSFDHLPNEWMDYYNPQTINQKIVGCLNEARRKYLETNDKRYWWVMIQLLPSSYNQRRTLFLNYEVLWNIYRARKNHKLDEWRDFCKTIVEEVPYFGEIFGIEAKTDV